MRHTSESEGRVILRKVKLVGILHNHRSISSMALDTEPATIEEQEEIDEEEWEPRLDAPAHHPSAPLDEVKI